MINNQLTAFRPHGHFCHETVCDSQIVQLSSLSPLSFALYLALCCFAQNPPKKQPIFYFKATWLQLSAITAYHLKTCGLSVTSLPFVSGDRDCN